MSPFLQTSWSFSKTTFPREVKSCLCKLYKLYHDFYIVFNVIHNFSKAITLYLFEVKWEAPTVLSLVPWSV